MISRKGKHARNINKKPTYAIRKVRCIPCLCTFTLAAYKTLQVLYLLEVPALW